MKKILWLLLVVFIVIQFFRPAKNRTEAASPASIARLYPVPDSVARLLQVACNDCHSNNTRYPWYAEVQPVAWWLANHVEEGKRELNFDAFGTYSLRRQYHKLEETIEMVKDGAMPLESYTWLHRNARLSDADKRTLSAWADGIMQQMRTTYPPDSLQRKPQ